MNEKILILDFGSQYTQLIARRVREINVYCEIYPFNHFPAPDKSVKGVILSGSPSSVHDKNAPKPDLKGIKGSIPLLGICYGAQYLVHFFGGEVSRSSAREYGRANLLYTDPEDQLFKDIPTGSQVWMSHGDTIARLPENYKITGSTSGVRAGAYRINGELTWGIQFHPEVYHTSDGKKILENFVVDICGCNRSWTPDSFIGSSVAFLREQIGDDKVILGLSGGVDSTVAAALLNKASGRNLTCIFVDNGLLRKNEFGKVMDSYLGLGLNVVGVDAADKFLDALEGISDPEEKRKTIGRVFIEVFEEEARKVKDVKWLAQGTIYPDVIESVSVKGPSATIKSHHNVGGLPERMHLKVIEPLRLLFKDEVRRVGYSLGLPDTILKRHPFPGPGLAIRILGKITRQNIETLKEADEIFIEGLRKHDLYDSIWQAGVILLPVQSVGVMGDERTYENTVVLRAVNSTDGMTADWSYLPHEFLRTISNEIINRVKGINRVVYDISSKPPATIEWE
ncbi:MAG: glutamine-hydrolyzing GMP synthase [Bacteroidales bacterium]|nr:glutamine-hydrolyzing GMP synthase [Bacteroidales bacterium]NMD03729.1 glutamine-hydrolyzing GMP synthase [Bacteroidales bacterium]OQB65029.1 MAG: GMP synthase (glutamine-hydrolyzing) [Bacteroidetes bacterium ADurb.Bin145]HOU03320.1 glutamine-hydrolyzing GMP synthase [Bacteroidales bacterium]HQK66984.1 glutamine-hydrolyzing GMP synthase [Bacteroidales bacterium]